MVEDAEQRGWQVAAVFDYVAEVAVQGYLWLEEWTKAQRGFLRRSRCGDFSLGVVAGECLGRRGGKGR